MSISCLNNELSRICAQAPFGTADGWLCSYDLKADFIGFSGHFPEYPILPAFIQVKMVQHMLQTALGTPLRLSRISRAKFTGQARPGDRLLVECSTVESTREGKGWTCLISAGSDNQIAKFRIYFAA